MWFQPGPEERKWTSRLRFKLTGRWPDAVVAERLAGLSQRPMSPNVKAILKDVYRFDEQESQG